MSASPPAGSGVWSDLVGQERAVEVLRRAVMGEKNSMTHAWLLTGPPGSGRSNAARAFAGAGLHGEADHRDLARLEPAHELLLACLAQVGARRQCDDGEGHGQPEEGEAAVGYFKKTAGHIGREGAHAGNRFP